LYASTRLLELVCVKRGVPAGRMFCSPSRSSSLRAARPVFSISQRRTKPNASLLSQV
jgi:hypothetical protein